MEMEFTLEDVRGRLLYNNELYNINLGEQISIILNEGIVQEESLLQKDRHALDIYRRKRIGSKEEEQDADVKEEKTEEDKHQTVEQHELAYKVIVCSQCTKTFKRRSQMMRHVREVHENQRLYQCDVCPKRFNRQSTKNRHAVTCKRNPNKISTYTLPSFLRGYHIYKKHWTPVIDGDDHTLICIKETNNRYDETAVAVVISNKDNQVAGYVPKSLSSVFTKFLSTPRGIITVKVVDSVIDRGFGLEIPVDYIFHSNHCDILELLENIEKRL